MKAIVFPSGDHVGIEYSIDEARVAAEGPAPDSAQTTTTSATFFKATPLYNGTRPVEPGLSAALSTQAIGQDDRLICRTNVVITATNEWAHLGLNQGPLACEASALPLSYAP
jgi:hypothetical protein